MSFNIFSGDVIRMYGDGTDVRVMISGLSGPRGLTTICLPTNEPKTTFTPGTVSLPWLIIPTLLLIDRMLPLVEVCLIQRFYTYHLTN